MSVLCINYFRFRSFSFLSVLGFPASLYYPWNAFHLMASHVTSRYIAASNSLQSLYCDFQLVKVQQSCLLSNGKGLVYRLGLRSGLGTGNGFYSFFFFSVLKSDNTCGGVVCDAMRLHVLTACWSRLHNFVMYGVPYGPFCHSVILRFPVSHDKIWGISPGKWGPWVPIFLVNWGPPTSSTTQLSHERSKPKSQPVYIEPVLRM